MSAKLKEKLKESLVKRMIVLVPEKGSFPEFLQCSTFFAKALKTSLRLYVGVRFLSERPRKDQFYREIVEEQCAQQGIHWDTHVFEDALTEEVRKLSPREHILVLLKGEGHHHEDLETLFCEATCPILVIPENFHREFRRIVVAYSNGRFGHRALEIAAGCSSYGRCQVNIISVGSPNSGNLRAAHARAKYFMSLQKVSADYRILSGQVKAAILEMCKKNDADLLILGASDPADGKTQRFYSLSQEVAAEANCPVMIVK